MNQPGQTYAENFLKAEEIGVGKNLEVFGRTYFLEGCDEFTQNYYASKFNIKFPLSLNESNKNKEVKSSI